MLRRMLAALIAEPETVMPHPRGAGKKYKRCCCGAVVE
jgi:hypothetical protein